MSNTVTLRTGLAPEQVRQRLTDAIDPPWTIGGKRPVQGRVGDHTASLSRRLTYNNSFQTHLSLVLEPEDEARGRGVILHGSFGLGLFAKLVLFFLADVVLILAVSAGLREGVHPVLPWVVGAGGLAAVGLVYAVGRSMAQGDRDILTRFLVQTLDARVVPTARRD